MAFTYSPYMLDGWPNPEQLEIEKRKWKDCVCGRPLYIILHKSSKFQLPADFRSLWPFQNTRGWVIHASREETEACQARLAHFTDYPFVNHHYDEVMGLEERAKAVHLIFSRVKGNLFNSTTPSGECKVCQKHWFLMYDPVTGEPVTVHKTIDQERRCAVLARIVQGAKP